MFNKILLNLTNLNDHTITLRGGCCQIKLVRGGLNKTSKRGSNKTSKRGCGQLKLVRAVCGQIKLVRGVCGQIQLVRGVCGQIQLVRPHHFLFIEVTVPSQERQPLYMLC